MNERESHERNDLASTVRFGVDTGGEGEGYCSGYCLGAFMMCEDHHSS